MDKKCRDCGLGEEVEKLRGENKSLKEELQKLRLGLYGLKASKKRRKDSAGIQSEFYNKFFFNYNFFNYNWDWEETDLLQDMETEWDPIGEIDVWGEDYLTLGTSFEIEDLGDRKSIREITGEFVRYKKLIPKVAKELAD